MNTSGGSVGEMGGNGGMDGVAVKGLYGECMGSNKVYAW